MAVHVFTSDGSNILPPPNSRPVSVSFDCSALSRLTKHSEFSRDAEAKAVRKWMRQFAPGKLDLIVGPAVTELVYKKDAARFVDLPFVQRCKLNQLTGRAYRVPEPRQHAQSVASTLMRVAGHTLNILAMQEAFSVYGAKRDESTALKRLEHFIQWANARPQLGGTCLVGVAMHEALTFNERATKAFSVGATKIDFVKLLNGAWDLYQLEFLLNFESDYIGKHPNAMSVYLTCDLRLASVFAKVGVVDPIHRLVGVDPVTMKEYPRICAVSQEAIQHVRALPGTFIDFRKQAEQLAETFGSFAARYDDRGLRILHRRLVEVVKSLSGDSQYRLEARKPT